MIEESQSKNPIGKYFIKPFSKNRQLLSELYDEFLKKHYSVGYFEVNVTKGKELIDQYLVKTGEKISFTSWIVKCISDAVVKYPEINSFRKGRSKIIVFEDIDIIVMVERKLSNKVIPIPYSIRKSSEKSLLSVSREIRLAQEMKVSEEDQLLDQGLGVKLFPFIPRFIRKWFIRRTIHNPFAVKKQGGLIVVTSVGMFANVRGWVGGFGGITTLSIAIGGITQKLVKKENEINEEQFLQVTLLIDHDLIDGGPATRFTSYLVNLLEHGQGLLEL